MIDKVLKLEVTRAELMENGNVTLSPSLAGGLRSMGFGIPLVLFGIYISINGIETMIFSLILLAVGGLLIYVGAWGLSTPEITFDIENQIVLIKRRKDVSSEKWHIEGISDAFSQPFTISGLGQMGMGLVRARLAVDQDKSILLFITGNKAKAMLISQWINNALEISAAIKKRAAN